MATANSPASKLSATHAEERLDRIERRDGDRRDERCLAYYLALRQTQGTIRTETPNWQPWQLFFLRALAEQVRRLNCKVERERLVLAALPQLSLQIVEFAREHGRITMGMRSG